MQCKKQITGTDDLAKRKMMAWLLEGTGICGGLEDRKKHVGIDARKIDPPSEAELVAKRIRICGV